MIGMCDGDLSLCLQIVWVIFDFAKAITRIISLHTYNQLAIEMVECPK